MQVGVVGGDLGGLTTINLYVVSVFFKEIFKQSLCGARVVNDVVLVWLVG